MTDAQLMTATPDIPGLKVFEYKTMFGVSVNDEPLGLITQYHTVFSGPSFEARCGTEYANCNTRNDAVRWILNQHKGEQK